MISPLLIVSLSFIKIIYSETCNYSFSCDLEEKSDYCAIKKRTDSESIFEIKLQKNPKMPCNIYEILLGDSEKKASYQTSSNNTYKYPSYPGGVCQSSLNCLSGLCTNGETCSDSKIDDTCYYHENCPLNTACINGTCRPYFKKGENCKKVKIVLTHINVNMIHFVINKVKNAKNYFIMKIMQISLIMPL